MSGALQRLQLARRPEAKASSKLADRRQAWQSGRDWWLSGAHHVGSLGHGKDLGGCLSDGEASRFFLTRYHAALVVRTSGKGHFQRQKSEIKTSQRLLGTKTCQTTQARQSPLLFFFFLTTQRVFYSPRDITISREHIPIILENKVIGTVIVLIFSVLMMKNHKDQR